MITLNTLSVIGKYSGPMVATSNNKQIVIFAKKSLERDYLRNGLSNRNGKTIRAICFENETICFDNLASIDPQTILIRTDSSDQVWRFLFALQGLELNSQLVILSNKLSDAQFNQCGIKDCVQFIPLKIDGADLIGRIENTICTGKATSCADGAGFIVGKSPVIQRVNTMLPSLINSPDPIMITGEAGTGKELLARLIVSHQKDSSIFIKIDCSQIDSLVSNHTLGLNQQSQFVTDSAVNRPIVILLDKIHLLEKKSQSEILLILENGFRLTIDLMKVSDEAKFRFIATSEVEIHQLEKSNNFRKALLYRLNVIPIHMPPLRQRTEDVPLLIDYFVIDTCTKMKRSYVMPSQRVLEKLIAYDWPGNVAELQQLIERMSVTGDENHILAHNGIQYIKKSSNKDLIHILDTDTLPNSFEITNYLSDLGERSLKTISDKFVSRTEKLIMQKALETTNWNRKKAAALLHISYKSMLNKMKMYEIV